MRNFTVPAVAVLSLLLAAPLADAKELRKQKQFDAAVVGKKLVSGDTWILIAADGSMTGISRTKEKITGAWIWNKRYFCRNVVVGAKAFPQDCLEVSIEGDTVTFIRDKGKGKAVPYTISN